MVLDSGNIVVCAHLHSNMRTLINALRQEFDTPLSLYLKEGGFFRGLCDKSNITERDILKD